MNRRNFVKTTAGLLVAPWVVKAENLMPVKVIEKAPDWDGLTLYFTTNEGRTWRQIPRYVYNPVTGTCDKIL